VTWVAGADGCRGGWVVLDALVEDGAVTALEARIAETPAELLESGRRPRLVALDIPIGLLEERRRGGRDCDRAARAVLGRRGCSVFSPPVRPILGAQTYGEVRGAGISIQAFHIMAKIASVDAWITPARQEMVFEGHPEVAFAHLAGVPMTHNKKRSAGRRERLAALEPHLPDIAELVKARLFPRKTVARDDLLDAAVLTLVARDKLLGRAVSLPDPPPRDARGLDMAIWSLAY